MQDKEDGGEQQRSYSPETSLQLQRCDMARYREEGTTHWIGIWPSQLVEFSSVADPKHPRRILHLLSALQGQTLEELHLLCRKKQLTSSSPVIFEIAVSLVLENSAPPTLHSVVWWLDCRLNTMFCHR